MRDFLKMLFCQHAWSNKWEGESWKLGSTRVWACAKCPKVIRHTCRYEAPPPARPRLVVTGPDRPNGFSVFGLPDVNMEAPPMPRINPPRRVPVVRELELGRRVVAEACAVMEGRRAGTGQLYEAVRAYRSEVEGKVEADE